MSFVRYGILLFGVAFYAFSITTLIKVISKSFIIPGQECFVKSFFRIIDTGNDEILDKKELKAFDPCPEYDPKKINRIFSHYGRRADINDLADEIDPKGIIKPCIGDVASFTNPEHLKNLKQSQVLTEMLETYDINNDEIVSWGEYNIGNSILKKELPYARTIFKFFDKNRDYELSKKELTKVKVKQLATFIGSGGKRRK